MRINTYRSQMGYIDREQQEVTGDNEELDIAFQHLINTAIAQIDNNSI